MPRTARKKSKECMYHIMCRSISEIDLFQSDEDRSYYLSLLKRYKEKFQCTIYAYCLMDNHVHLYINPCGFDISSFMLSLNTAYVVYFNRRYHRHGHLFQGRFASLIVDNDRYSAVLSAYIHNNAKSLPESTGKEENYPYSSYGIYTGARKDIFGIVDTDFLLRQFGSDKKSAQERYRRFTESLKDTGLIRQIDESIVRAYMDNEYKSEKKQITRYETPECLLSRISELIGEKLHKRLRMKYTRETSKIRAFVAYVMRVLCGYTYKQICEYIGNMSVSGITRLTKVGFKLVCDFEPYQNAFNSIIYSI